MLPFSRFLCGGRKEIYASCTIINLTHTHSQITLITTNTINDLRSILVRVFRQQVYRSGDRGKNFSGASV